MKYRLLLYFLFGFICVYTNKAQVSYNSAATYGLRKIIPAYSNSAIQVLRACDNATANIGFTSCGDLDTTTLKNFVLVPNPISAITSSVGAAYGLRRLKCGATSAIQVRRSCDNATLNIGFTALGDFDTVSLKTFVIASNPLSAISAAAAAAYSLRKLSCTYAGKAIQVRRSSDNTTQDIGFTASGDLDTASMKTFVGANSAFVTIWYDQSGNVRNVTQVTNALQPRIMNAGVIDNDANGKPTVFFNGTYLTNNAFVLTTQPISTSCVWKATSLANPGGEIFGWGNNTTLGSRYGAWFNFISATQGDYGVEDLGAGIVGTVLNTNTWYIASQILPNSTVTNLTQWINGTAQVMSNISAPGNLNIVAAGSEFAIGTIPIAHTQGINGNIHELIYFGSSLSTADRQYLEWGQSQYYNIAGPVLSATLPAGAPSAYATTWYDQSGNGYNVTQATAASQPRIINAGKIDQQKGRPCLFFDGVASQMTNSVYSCLLNSQTPTWNAVIWPIATNNAYAAIASWRVAGGVCSQLELGGNNNWNTCWWSNNVNWTTINGTSIANGTFQILTALTNATSTQMYFNGSLSFNNTGQSNTAASAGNPVNGNITPLIIGNDNCCGGRFIKGYIPEIILSSNYFSTTDRQYLEWSQAQYYTVAGPVLVNLPGAAPSASIATWYDQSGNGINIQATGSRQPQIMNAGIVTRLGLAGTWPTIQGNNALQTNLTATFAATYAGSALSANSVLQADANSNANLRVMSFGNSALTSADWSNVNYCNINQRNNNQFVIERNGVNPATTFVVATPMVLSARFDGANHQLFNDGTGSATTADANAFNFNAFRLLQSINPSFEAGEAITGKMSEFNLFYSALNTTRRTLQETNQSAYYNIAISNSKYTPPSATTYNRFVLGVGRESATDSVCSTRQSAGMGFTLSTNAAAYLIDNGDYITAGINCPITSSTNITFLPAPILLRWDNDWYVNKTDIVGTAGGTLSVYFDFNDYHIGTSPGAAANYSLLNRPTTASNFTVIAGATANVSGSRVYFTVDANNLPTNSYYTIGTKNPPVSPLPIELLNFDAAVCQKDVCIDWSTASEVNTDYFSIERSIDAQNFSEIKKVKGAGNSQRTLNYSAMDYEPLPGISYYRLKQVDINQNFTYTKTDAVEFKNDITVGIYPNPSTGQINISNCKNYDKLYVADLLGRTVYSSDVSKESMNLDLNNLPGGEYFITLTNSTTKNKYTSKIVIEKKQ